MVLSRRNGGKTLFFIVLLFLRINGNECKRLVWNPGNDGVTKDQFSTRANTLFDNVDDTQRQLDNEVREHLGQPKPVWIINIPTRFPIFRPEARHLRSSTPSNIFMRYRRAENAPAQTNYDDVNEPTAEPYPCFDEPCECKKETPEWNFRTQDKWRETFKSCGGRWQSPVDLPARGLVRARGARRLLFVNYETAPRRLTLRNDGNSLILTGEWARGQWPLVCGGAAHSRRYRFHSVTFRWPSEHAVSSFHYPLESQVLHVSAEYGSLEEAAAAINDPQAFLGVINIYKYGARTHEGTQVIMDAALGCLAAGTKVDLSPAPLSSFSPPFEEYVCYHGSLTAPPCTESVLWLARRRSLWLTRDAAEAINSLTGTYEKAQNPSGRRPQPLNDRRVFLFTQE